MCFLFLYANMSHRKKLIFFLSFNKPNLKSITCTPKNLFSPIISFFMPNVQLASIDYYATLIQFLVILLYILITIRMKRICFEWKTVIFKSEFYRKLLIVITTTTIQYLGIKFSIKIIFKCLFEVWCKYMVNRKLKWFKFHIYDTFLTQI